MVSTRINNRTYFQMTSSTDLGHGNRLKDIFRTYFRLCGKECGVMETATYDMDSAKGFKSKEPLYRKSLQKLERLKREVFNKFVEMIDI